MNSARKQFQKTLQKGFTLIELLVVIGILGILATALVATIDPFEQLRKAADANTKNAVVEYANANLRYYTTHNELPWGKDDAAANTCPTNGTEGYTATADTDTLDTTLAPCVNILIEDGELKTQFADATNITQGIIANGTDNSMRVCYQPQSKSQQRDINTKYDFDGSLQPAGTCKSDTTSPGVTDCYWCADL